MKTVVRLDKYLSDMGEGTRSTVKEKIRRGLVTVNGRPASGPEMKINTLADVVVCDGRALSYVHYEYYMLHKPAGVISATESPQDRTVVDLIDCKKRKDLFPVGRLDKDTEGLLLLTNDGELCHRLLSPKKHVSKLYYQLRQTMLPSPFLSHGLLPHFLPAEAPPAPSSHGSRNGRTSCL